MNSLSHRAAEDNMGPLLWGSLTINIIIIMSVMSYLSLLLCSLEILRIRAYDVHTSMHRHHPSRPLHRYRAVTFAYTFYPISRKSVYYTIHHWA